VYALANGGRDPLSLDQQAGQTRTEQLCLATQLGQGGDLSAHWSSLA
jgi:hypothetical protein